MLGKDALKEVNELKETILEARPTLKDFNPAAVLERRKNGEGIRDIADSMDFAESALYVLFMAEVIAKNNYYHEFDEKELKYHKRMVHDAKQYFEKDNSLQGEIDETARFIEATKKKIAEKGFDPESKNIVFCTIDKD